MRYDILKQRLADEKQLLRITAQTLDEYNQSLKYPSGVPSWKQREEHMCTRLIESGFSKTECQNVYDHYPVGENYRAQSDRQQYFDDTYKNAEANAKFSKSPPRINFNHVRSK